MVVAKYPWLPHLYPCQCYIHRDPPRHIWADGAKGPVWVDTETGEIIRDHETAPVDVGVLHNTHVVAWLMEDPPVGLAPLSERRREWAKRSKNRWDPIAKKIR